MSLNISCCEWFCMSVTDVNINFYWTWWYGEGAAQWVLDCKGKPASRGRPTSWVAGAIMHAVGLWPPEIMAIVEGCGSQANPIRDRKVTTYDYKRMDRWPMSSIIKQFSCQRTSYHHRQFFNYRERERVTGNRLWWLVMMRLIGIIIDGRWLLVEDRK